MNYSRPVNIAVIGVGYFGRLHAQKLLKVANANLVAVCDADQKTAAKVASSIARPVARHYQDVIGCVDAVVITTPAATHYQIGKFFLENGKHVLVEKPITKKDCHAKELIKIADTNNLILQVGHIERFNPCVRVLQALHNFKDTCTISVTRTCPYKERIKDDIIYDMVIHDIDLLQFLLRNSIKEITATGEKLVSNTNDKVQAEIVYDNGTVASIYAFRNDVQTNRTINITQRNMVIQADLHKSEIAVFHKKNMTEPIQQVNLIKNLAVTDDALSQELQNFIGSICKYTQPMASGHDGLQALALANICLQYIERDAEK